MAEQVEERVYEVPVADIDVSPWNVRKDQGTIDADLDQLAASIKRFGLLQPVVLLGTFGHPRYKLIVGQRRLEAHKRLNRTHIRAIFQKADKQHAIILSLVENLLRSNLNHADAAAAVTQLYRSLGQNDRAVSRETGLSLTMVRRYLDIKERATPAMLDFLAQDRVAPRDLQRALDAAGGDAQKAERILRRFPELPDYARARARDYGMSKPDATADEILREANKPRHSINVVVNLTTDEDKALDDAAKRMHLDREEVARHALLAWLRSEGLLP